MARRRASMDVEAEPDWGAPPEPLPDPPVAALNGHARDAESARAIIQTDPDLRDWQRGLEALNRMEPTTRLGYLRHLQETVRTAEAEAAARTEHTNRLRWEPEAMLESGIGEKLGARVLTGIPTEPPPPLLIGRLDPMGHTILYGTGGVGKGTLGSSWMAGLLEDEKRILIVDYENHPGEWARRISGMGAGILMNRVLHVAPLTASWRGKRGAIWNQAADLRELAGQFGADYMLVDSIVPACAGSDPLKPESVSLYAGALEYIGQPTLSLGHVTKADDLRYPFGSIFWHNLARTTWSLKADGGTVILTHRKHNNYARVAALRVEVTWNSDGMPVEVWERSYSEDLSRRISSLLVGQSLTVKAICDGLDEENLDDEAEPAKADTVSKALRRGAKSQPPRFVREGSDRWRNA